ncbi:MAG: type II secretion system F family protein [Candidatus Aenigmarchaeota archaeon]|nr:type II secretion system F family protein [Candidatus Aenigmarchaeota archaeon]
MEIDKTIALEVLFVLLGLVILISNFLFLAAVAPLLSPVINMIGALVAIVPPFFIFYEKYMRSKEIEEEFIIFITDLTESIDSGMTLPLALKHAAQKDYRSLTPYVKEIESKVEWGVPFEKALAIFADKVKSKPIKRSVGTIIETYKVGGKISDTLKAIGQSLIEIHKIKQERSTSVQSQVVTSYLIYFVFIFILLILQVFLIPALTKTTVSPLESETTQPEMPSELFTQTFVNFIIIQGFFAGLATGKMAEGSLVAGFKHSLVLIVIGYTFFSIFGQLHISIF